jgi:hypothetical protein
VSSPEARYAAIRRQFRFSFAVAGGLIGAAMLAAVLNWPGISKVVFWIGIAAMTVAIVNRNRMRKAYWGMRAEQGADRVTTMKEWEKINPPGGG